MSDPDMLSAAAVAVPKQLRGSSSGSYRVGEHSSWAYAQNSYIAGGKTSVLHLASCPGSGSCHFWQLQNRDQLHGPEKLNLVFCRCRGSKGGEVASQSQTIAQTPVGTRDEVNTNGAQRNKFLPWEDGNPQLAAGHTTQLAAEVSQSLVPMMFHGISLLSCHFSTGNISQSLGNMFLYFSHILLQLKSVWPSLIPSVKFQSLDSMQHSKILQFIVSSETMDLQN